VTISEAIKAADDDGWRGIVLRDPGNPNRKRIYLAFNRQWEDRGDPNCLTPATYTNDELTADTWEPADDV
jgi:hypothetical protein